MTAGVQENKSKHTRGLKITWFKHGIKTLNQTHAGMATYSVTLSLLSLQMRIMLKFQSIHNRSHTIDLMN